MIDLECIDDATNGRFYEDDEGNYYPSVTTKLGKVVATGEGLLRWYAQQNSYQEAIDYMHQRGQQGTNIHAAAERLIHGGVIKTTDNDLNTKSIKKIQGFINFWNKYQPIVHNTEFVVRSCELVFAGRVDLLLTVPSEGYDYCIVDIKTSKSIYNKHKLQLMFYRYALEEMGVLDSDDIGIYVLLLKHRTKKGYQFKEIDYCPELVVMKNREYNHKFYSGCDMEPKFPEEFPEELQLNSEQVEELNEIPEDEANSKADDPVQSAH